jgi:uncharacterized membrane protein
MLREPALLTRSAIFQALEERVMLDIGGANSLPPTIVVGRTLSAYDVPDVKNNQETLTFTVYNQAADPITGVLLTDALESGVTFASASQLPDQNGQQLAWSLGTIQPYDRASVTLTVSLANPIPTQLDTGASAYGTLDAGMVNWTTAPATLRTTAIAADFLASTPDANTTDPYIQEEAAQLNYDPAEIFNFLQTQIGYNSYVGSLRGARGTLWSDAGNSLDDASLGVALMRASGIPAQYEQGTLSQSQAQQLILSMFPASYQTVGSIPAGTQLSDPADDPTLLAETEYHFWFQFDTGNGMTDADPEFAAQAIGQAATTSTNSFTAVPQSLEQTTEVSLTAEIYSQATAVFAPGVSPFTDTVVLDQTFNDVDLVGVPLSIGNSVSASGISGLLSNVTFTYSPYIRLGDGSTPGSDTTIPGTAYQETYTNLAYGSQVLTGLFLKVASESPEANGQPQTTTVSKTLFDRIGFAARQPGGTPSVGVPSSPTPALNSLDIVTLQISGETESASAVSTQTALLSAVTAQERQLASVASQAESGSANAAANDLNLQTAEEAIETNSFLGEDFLAKSDLATAGMAAPLFADVYFGSPRIVAASSTFTLTSPAVGVSYSIDILQDTPRVVIAPSQAETMELTFQFVHGFSDSVIEGEVLQPLQAASGTEVASAMSTFLAEISEGPAEVLVAPSDISVLDPIPVSTDAKARISAAVDAGMVVVVPLTPLEQNGAATIAWLQIDPTSGVAVAVNEQGSHGAGTEYETADLIAQDAAVAAFRGATGAAAISAADGAATEGGLLVVETAEQEGLAANLTRSQLKDFVINALLQYESRTKAFVLEEIPVGKSEVQAYFVFQFSGAFTTRIVWMLQIVKKEPPLSDVLAEPSADEPAAPSASTPVAAVASLAPGAVAGTTNVREVQAYGTLSATWRAASTTFTTSSMNSSSGTVTNSSGHVLGSGSVGFVTNTPIGVEISGSNQFNVSGNGNLSFYGPAETNVGAAGDWESYSATVTGDVTMKVTTGLLTLNGTMLPVGTYSIATNSASLSGSGTTSSPNFAGSASLTATSGTVALGPGSGSLSVGGSTINTSNETTLAGYSGTVSVSASGNGTDEVTVTGNAANVLTVALSPGTLSTDQNTPVSFSANLQTSFADTYRLTANAPTGWSVTVDDNGKVTATPPPGTQSGTYPIQVIAQSTTDPFLVSQATIEVTVTPTIPGMMLMVSPDTLITVPFNGAEIPSAFQATMQNTGPAPDTYSLTFSNVPSGWTIVDSRTSDTVPAGETGILGIYLEPTGNQLPAPGTQVSFTVTATSKTDPSIAQTVNVSFTMPAIAAATVTSNPAAVSTTPGTATTATITITNVGNVPYNGALATTTDSGLTISGLSSPGMIPVGQSVTETATLTPDASTPLNSTLSGTVNVGQAAAQNGVSVVRVNTLAGQAGGTPAPQSTLDVLADIQSEVGQQEQGSASFTVTNGSGQTVFTSTAVPVTLSTIDELDTIDLGAFSTAGFAAGQYTITVLIDNSSGNPIAGASNTTTMAVGLPVSASVSVDTDNQTPGPVTSTETLSVTSNTVIGNVATDSTATSVAVNGTLAYVAGTQDISVVDISEPTSPKVLGTFGSTDLNLNGGTAFNLVGLAGDDLIVASQAETSTISVLVYSLANPQSPTLLGSATVPYSYLDAMTIEGTTAYLSTYGQSYDANGNVVSQQGELVAVDFSNPATTVIGGALYNDQPQPVGHASFVGQSAVVNPQTLLVTGSTSTGANTQTGTGQVTAVHTGAGGALSGGATLTIPGTVDAVGIAVGGTYALVVGSTGGSISPVSPSSVGLSGNVTLTLLDITNPASPTVVGTTVVTQDTFEPVDLFPLGAVDVVALGDGQFAVNGTASNGSPTILYVDASDPNNLVTSNLSTNASANGLTLAGAQLFGAAADGLTIYQPAALATTPVTVIVTVPTNGVSIVPNSFSVAPTNTTSGANSETLTWTLNLTPGKNQQITWQTNIADLQAEQVQPVVTAASVQFTSPGSAPQSVGVTLNGSSLNVAGVPTPVSVTIPVEVAAPGVPAIANAAIAAQNLNITGLSAQLNDLATALTNLVQTPTSNVYLSQATAALASIITLVTNDPFLGTYTASLTAAQTSLSAATTVAESQTAIANLGTALDSFAQAITDYALHGFTLSLASNQALALPGAATLFTVQLENTGTETTTYDFSVSGLPAGVTAQFSQPSITLAPGQSIPQGTTTVTLSLTQSGTSLVGGGFTVTATAEGAPETTLSTQGQLTLLGESLAVPVVTVTPPFSQPGGRVDVTAKIQSVVNEPHTLTASFTVTDPSGNVIYTDANPISVPLTNTTGLTTVDLGNIDTTGFVDGIDTVTVTVTDTSPPGTVGTALATATGQTTLIIGLPVSASITTNPGLLPANIAEGALNVTTTLSVDAETPFPDPLTLDGQVPTTPTGTDVALYPSAGKTYAYVSGTNGIDIVDVTNPASPVDEGAFGTGDIVKGGVTLGRIATLGGTDYLIVGTSATLNANEFTLLIYSLADPLAPAKVSGTEFDYEFMNELLIDGTTLIVPTAGLFFFAGGLDGVYGTVLSIDISDPAAPTLKDVLYNNPGGPEAGDTQQIGGVVAQSGLAYITSSTETSGSLPSGVGRVLVVDDSNPADLSVTKEVDIPGTEQGLGIAIQGTQALVVSSTAGPTGNLSNYSQASGNLVLSLLDISNPASPQLIGTSLITADAFGTTASNTGGAISVLPLGNGLYAVSGVVDNGTSVLLLVDPTDPNNITVSATPLPVGGNEMAVSGNILYATSSQGLTTYQIGSVEHTSYTASVEVPTDANTSIVSGSFNIPPTSITTGANFDTLTWVRQLAFGQDLQTFSWQTQARFLAAGEVRPVTLGTSLSFVSQNTPGSVDLPATSVTGEPLAEVLPSASTMLPGSTATFDLRLFNPTNAAVRYHLQANIGINSTNSLPTTTATEPVVGPGATVDIPFQITAGSFDRTGVFGSGIVVYGELPANSNVTTGASDDATFNITIAGTPVLPTPDAHGVSVSITPAKASAGLNDLVQYTVQVTNTGSVEDTFVLGLSGTSGLFNQYLSQNTVTVQPGASNFQDVTLTLQPDVVATPGDENFTVSATSQTTSGITATANSTLTILPLGVSVILTPSTSSTAPGAPYQVQVYNNGKTNDAFNLSLAGPAAQIASLTATQTMALAPGGSQTIDISTTAAGFADAGNLPLTVVATSQTNPAVQGASTANLTVPSTQSVTASFSPPTQNLSAPGATSFLLQVNNTGNTEDSYSATITGTTGPITASLIGLDGQPAQSVPLFILPGLAQGAILLDVSGASPGQGTVTVTIQSLTNSSESTTATATLNVGTPVQMQLAMSANSGLTTVEAATAPITGSLLTAAVPNGNTPATDIVYTVTTVPANGPLLLNGQALAVGGTFTQDDLNNGRLEYQSTEEGADSFNFSVAATNALGTSGTFQITASDPALIPTGGFTYSATEGTAVTAQTVATFTDPGGVEALADYSATIGWGDGTSTTAGTISVDPNTHVFTVAGEHTYAQDGTFTVTVTLTHERSPNVTATSSADISAGTTPVLTLVHDLPAAATEGFSTTLTDALLATSDSDSSVTPANIVYTLSVPPSQGTLLLSGEALAQSGTFTQDDINNGRLTYQSTEEGTDSFTFSVAAGAAATINGTFSITSSDPAVVATGGFTYAATEGTAATAQTVATFTDPGGAEPLADYSATIDWGDGTSTTPGSISVDPNTHVFTVSGQHDYAQDGTFSVEVTVTHESAPTVTVTSTAEIAGATVTGSGGIVATAAAVTGYEYSAPTNVPVATFTDGDGSLPAGDFSASIDWGDGTTSAGSISLSSGTYTVSGSHEYLDEGHYTVRVSVDQTAGTPTNGATSATVSATAAIHEQLLANGTVGTADQNWIQEIYRDLFNRQAEMQGLGFWVAELAKGESRAQVAEQMVEMASFEEFQHDTVTALYEQYLGRAPDPGGLAYWSAYLYQGGTIESMSQALVSSPEYWQARAGNTNSGFLNALFQDALRRQIDPAALTYFGTQMAQGASAADVASMVFASDEYHRVRVNAYFEEFFNRPADPGALAYFAGELDDGLTDEYVITQLISSDEYYDDVQV